MTSVLQGCWGPRPPQSICQEGACQAEPPRRPNGWPPSAPLCPGQVGRHTRPAGAARRPAALKRRRSRAVEPPSGGSEPAGQGSPETGVRRHHGGPAGPQHRDRPEGVVPDPTSPRLWTIPCSAGLAPVVVVDCGRTRPGSGRHRAHFVAGSSVRVNARLPVGCRRRLIGQKSATTARRLRWMPGRSRTSSRDATSSGTGIRTSEPDDGARPCGGLGDRVSQVPRPVGRDQDGVIHRARRRRAPPPAMRRHLRWCRWGRPPRPAPVASGTGQLRCCRRAGRPSIAGSTRRVRADEPGERPRRPAAAAAEAHPRDPQLVPGAAAASSGAQPGTAIADADSGQLDRRPGNDAERPPEIPPSAGQARSGVVLAQPRRVVGHRVGPDPLVSSTSWDRLDAEHPAAHVAVHASIGPHAGVGRHHRSQARIGPQVDQLATSPAEANLSFNVESLSAAGTIATRSSAKTSIRSTNRFRC